MSNSSYFISPLVLLLVVCWCLSASTFNLPPGVQKCRLSDDDCMTKAVQNVLKNNGKTGAKELALVSLDPLHIKKMTLAKNSNSPVSIDMKFTDVDLTGLSGAQVKHAGGFTKELNHDLVLDAFVPKTTFKGPYSIDGRVLILPIVGKGIGEISLENVHLTAKCKVRPNKKSDGTYVEVQNVQLSLVPARVHYDLEGLFNGQKDLSDNMHAFINENWADIFNELKPDIQEAIGLIFKHVLNHSFEKNSLETLFDE